jgi:hypothetical protein
VAKVVAALTMWRPLMKEVQVGGRTIMAMLMMTITTGRISHR